MTTLQNIIEHLEVDITNKTLHNGKKNPNKNKYYWFRNEYYRFRNEITLFNLAEMIIGV